MRAGADADAAFTRLSPGSNKVRVIVECGSFWGFDSDWPSGDGFPVAILNRVEAGLCGVWCCCVWWV